RYSFLADWGLVLCGVGLTLSDGRRAALLVLFGIVVGRLPLYLVSREPRAERVTSEGPINLAVAAALAGSAPFVGFAARVLPLRGCWSGSASARRSSLRGCERAGRIGNGLICRGAV